MPQEFDKLNHEKKLIFAKIFFLFIYNLFVSVFVSAIFTITPHGMNSANTHTQVEETDKIPLWLWLIVAILSLTVVVLFLTAIILIAILRRPGTSLYSVSSDTSAGPQQQFELVVPATVNGSTMPSDPLITKF